MQIEPRDPRRNIGRVIALAVLCLVVVALAAFAVQTFADNGRRGDRCAQEATINSQVGTSIARAGGGPRPVPCR